ncbi:hypothetical protein [Jeotgalicoccus sp. S0W5]|uniref:hypothetical protein n=1 Tax=Jeotgalicoccus sp. S0W5 TaxID=2527874 RepID=UPI001414F0C4|nr:hypothetical protein [Jeotgalicoccus sp. S0W5]
MEYLFNSKGKHIANFVGNQLHSPKGKNIGHYLKKDGVFIDMKGKYLGEIVQKNRLMSQRNSPYKNINYGRYGNYGNIGNYGNPGNYGSIGNVPGYDDISNFDNN